MGKRPWWRVTRSRGLALTGAILSSLLLVFDLFALAIADGDDWQTAGRVGMIFIYGFTSIACWTNWRKLRPAKQSL
jgi:hypothetical protein